ncbi:MAG: DUF6036 family nucleotidyltransferase [Defluviitaleaceae bacterium]|nr:DUF6036 family nucleotidyltransferase [Defluviitaleaceae bacterium]
MKKFLMDKAKLLSYFNKLNELLRMDNENLEIYVSGGANMCLYIQTRDATHDIDAGTRQGDASPEIPDKVKHYSQKMSELYELPMGWLNTGGNMHITAKMRETAVDGINLSNLTVYFLHWKSMLVLKIGAFREQPDITDAVAIIKKYNLKDANEIDAWMKELRGAWYHIGTRYNIEKMLDIAWNTEETPYTLLRTALDTKGYRDKTVDYYANLILSDLNIKKYDDIYETALVYLNEWA